MSTFTGTLGRGIFTTIGVIYLTRSVGIPAVQVGLGLSLAAVFGILAGPLAGRLSDVFGARRITIVSAVCTGLSLAGYLIVDDFVSFLVCASVVVSLECAQNVGRATVIATTIPDETRVHARAYLRSVNNLALAISAAAAGLALHLDTRAAYLGFICAAGVCHLLAGVLGRWIPKAPTVDDRREGNRWIVFRDRPYMLLTLLNTVLSVHYDVLAVVVPLWIVEFTDAPASIVALLVVINTAMVVLLQVRASRGIDDVRQAGRAQRQAGVYFLFSCGLYAGSVLHVPWASVALLALATVVHTVGELRQAAGAWGISFDLASPDAPGQYQGVYNMSLTAASIIAPGVLTALILGLGLLGWLITGVLLLCAGAAIGRA
ncbi:MFS transporter, partial [Streptosporangium algeriense]